MNSEKVGLAVDDVRNSLSQANYWLGEYQNAAGRDSELDAAGWNVESAYVTLLVLAEALNLPHLQAAIESTLKRARDSGVAQSETDEDEGQAWLIWARPARQFANAIAAVFGRNEATAVTRELETILRACVYSVTDRGVFEGPPAGEAAVHARIENVLRCIFPDLLHKPRLAKAIKQFEPDTGLPSIRTLIEYKYASDASQIATIADEILADTRGYESPDWDRVVFVVYETQRFRSELEWRTLLRDSGVPTSVEIVVLNGEKPLDKDAVLRPRRGAKRAESSESPNAVT
jgi:hypothetical protein